jgi:hypothetical protein
MCTVFLCTAEEPLAIPSAVLYNINLHYPIALPSFLPGAGNLGFAPWVVSYAKMNQKGNYGV